MLKKIEIALTVFSILLGTYEILGRTGVVSGPTPIEAVQDAVAGESTPRPPEQLDDLTIGVQSCRVIVDIVTIDVTATSTRPISTFDVQVSATAGALTDSANVRFDNSTTSSGWTLSLTPGPGMHEVTVAVDPDDRYEETDESNNVAAVTAEVPVDMLTTGTCSVQGT